MDAIWNALSVVITIFMMIALGMLLTRIGWLTDENAPLVSRLVVKVALPAMIVNNIFLKFTRETLIASLPSIGVSFATISVSLALGMLAGRVFHIPRGRRGVFACLFAFSNSVFIGVPVSRALFGDAVLPYTLLYYLCNTSIFWTVGIRLMQWDGRQPKTQKDYRSIFAYLAANDKDAEKWIPAKNALKSLGKLFPLPLITFVGCVALLCFGAKIPSFITTAAGYVGNMVTPLSLIYIGIILMRMIRKKSFRWQRAYWPVIAGRFIITPGLFLLFSWWTGMESLTRSVLLIQAIMPSMSQTPIIAGSSGSDEEFGAGGVALTTALSMITIPLYMALVTYVL